VAGASVVVLVLALLINLVYTALEWDPSMCRKTKVRRQTGQQTLANPAMLDELAGTKHVTSIVANFERAAESGQQPQPGSPTDHGSHDQTPASAGERKDVEESGRAADDMPNVDDYENQLGHAEEYEEDTADYEASGHHHTEPESVSRHGDHDDADLKAFYSP